MKITRVPTACLTGLDQLLEQVILQQGIGELLRVSKGFTCPDAMRTTRFLKLLNEDLLQDVKDEDDPRYLGESEVSGQNVSAYYTGTEVFSADELYDGSPAGTYAGIEVHLHRNPDESDATAHLVVLWLDVARSKWRAIPKVYLEGAEEILAIAHDTPGSFGALPISIRDAVAHLIAHTA